MQFATPSSPHTPLPNDVQKVMLQVLLALVPGTFAMGFYFGVGVWINIWIACTAALGFEALMLRLRGRSLAPLGDLSAVVTAVLLGLAVPPLLPWWMTVLGIGFAIVVAKHLYGGIGYNPFNPAMAGYALLLISYPVEMTS